MISLAWRFLPLICIAFGGLLALIGIGTAAGKVEAAPTAVALADIHPGVGPEWISVAGARPVWTEAVCQYRELRGRQINDTWYVPCTVSGTFASGSQIALVLEFSEADFQTLRAGGLPATGVFTGTVQPLSRMFGKAGRELPGQWPGVSGTVPVLDVDAAPLQRGPAAVLAVFGLLLGAGGWFWRRRRQAAPTAGGAVGGIQSGIEAGIREGVARALRG
ncbi:MAG: hypothetical protein IPK26_17855 [Planctomycetes bacterium]|nr:hypothetical protein [Planctomycetota bacterium]